MDVPPLEANKPDKALCHVTMNPGFLLGTGPKTGQLNCMALSALSAQYMRGPHIHLSEHTMHSVSARSYIEPVYPDRELLSGVPGHGG